MSGLIGQYLGRYHIIKQLGAGGMATVYEAFDTRLERTVAVKVIRTDMVAPSMVENILKRFEQEAKVLARLSHPNIVEIYDYGDYNQAPYLVMEYLPGGTLKQYTGAQVPFTEAAKLLLPAARALDYAHQREVIHRDVKPANILISASGEVKLSDFGIAKMLEIKQETQLTATGVGIGTPEYMAPEQWMGDVSEQTDQYALGVVLYELVTGRKPYTADTPAAVLLKQMNEQLPRPRLFIPDLPDEVEQVLFIVLAKEPQDRYPGMGAFIQALENLRTSATGSELVRLRSQDLPTILENTAPAVPERKKPGQTNKVNRPFPWKQILIGIAGLAGITILALILLVVFQFMRTMDQPNAIETEFAIADTQQAVIAISQTAQASAVATVSPTETSAAAPSATATIMPSPTATIPPTLGTGSTQVSSKDGMVMVYVPEGEFIMGADPSDEEAGTDERPQHTVYLDAYWMDQIEVTNAMYALCVDNGSCQPPQNLDASSVTNFYYGNPQYDFYPVLYISWNDAVDYCSWAGRHLPTEAEWEKAARGLNGQKYPWGNQPPNGTLVNLCDESCLFEKERVDAYNDGYPGVSPVGSFPQGASPYGALDMSGNVNEWVADFYTQDYYASSPKENPTGPPTSNLHVLRGGAAYLHPWYVRASHRAADWPNSNYSNLGFRCAASP